MKDDAAESLVPNLEESSNNDVTTTVNSNPIAENDDWAPDSEQPLILKMPSFVRLFVMRRILETYSGTIDALLDTSKIDKSMHETANDILFLLRDFGISKYMKHHYKEKEQAEVIEIIFNQIILKQFAKEYQNVTTFHAQSSDNGADYENILFNATDIVCMVFQFLVDSDGKKSVNELSNCSLVCSQWLYHAFNPNSIYHYSLKKLVIETKKYTQHYNNNVTRMWQRICNVKSLRLELGPRSIRYHSLSLRRNAKLNDDSSNDFLLSKLSTLRNVEVLRNGTGSIKHVKPIQAILRNCKHKIRSMTLELAPDAKDQNKLSPLVLNNVVDILIDHVYFAIIWTNKLEKLSLLWVPNCNEKWCNIVINNCDCSGMKELNFYNLRFDKSIDAKNKETKVLLNKFAQKFDNKNGNFKLLKITFYRTVDDCVLILWKALQSIIDKNGGHMELQLQSNLAGGSTNKIFDHIERNKPNIHKFEATSDRVHDKDGEYTKHIVSKCGAKGNNSLEWFKLDVSSNYTKIVKGLELKFPSKLAIVEFYDRNGRKHATLQLIIDLINWIKDDQHNVGFIFNGTVFCSKESKLAVKFGEFCEGVYSLLIEKQRAINVSIQVKELNESNVKNELFDTHSRYFSKDKMEKEYKKPKWNKIINKYMKQKCEPMTDFKDGKSYDGSTVHTFRVTNIEQRRKMLHG